MSIPSIQAPEWLRAASVSILTALVVAGCGSGGGRDDESQEGLDRYFLRDAATVEAMGLPVYWLGREFTAGGLVFRGPYVAEFGAEVEGGIAMTYLASVDGGNTGLRLTTYSRDAWELVKDRMMNPRLPGVTRKTVSVAGYNGDFLFESSATRPLNALWLILDLDDVVVVGQTNSGGPAYPDGPDYNPFINNPDLLVALMEDLRPYPE